MAPPVGYSLLLPFTTSFTLFGQNALLDLGNPTDETVFADGLLCHGHPPYGEIGLTPPEGALDTSALVILSSII